MSVTGHNRVRSVDDYYKTPAWATRAALRELPSLAGKHVLDPGIGIGAIALALPRDVHVTGVENHEGRVSETRAAFARMGRLQAMVHHADYLVWARGAPPQQFDLTISNPPFSLAMEFIQASLRISKITCMLLRLPWLASQGRADWLRANTPSVWVLPKRPRFVMNVRCGEAQKCGYEEAWSIGTKRPKQCPGCERKVTVVDSDATDYAWLTWGLGAPLVKILEVEKESHDE